MKGGRSKGLKRGNLRRIHTQHKHFVGKIDLIWYSCDICVSVRVVGYRGGRLRVREGGEWGEYCVGEGKGKEKEGVRLMGVLSFVL